MRIDVVRLYHVAMPLLQPWRTSYGEDHAVESILIEVVSDQGISAWSESSPLATPRYSSEWAGGVFALVERHLAPAVVGRDFGTGEALQDHLRSFKGNPFAKAALDTAWWVLDARTRSEPLHRHLGAIRDTVAVGADFGVSNSIDALLDQIHEAVASRFARVKLKFRDGRDLAMLREVRRAFPRLVLHIDCNAGCTLGDMALFEQLDRLELAMIEQPLGHDDLLDHATLQSRLATPICLDESISSPQRMQQAIAMGSCRFVNIKPGRVGGLTPAKAIYELGRTAGIGMWVGGMLESAVGAGVCTALAMLEGFTYPPDIFPSTRFYRNDLGRPHVELVAGEGGAPSVQASACPGLAAAPDPALLRAYSLAQAEVRAK